MYPGNQAKKYSKRPAFIMASTGETVTYKEFEARSNQLAHFFREEGLKKGLKKEKLDRIGCFMLDLNCSFVECIFYFKCLQ